MEVNDVDFNFLMKTEDEYMYYHYHYSRFSLTFKHHIRIFNKNKTISITVAKFSDKNHCLLSLAMLGKAYYDQKTEDAG